MYVVNFWKETFLKGGLQQHYDDSQYINKIRQEEIPQMQWLFRLLTYPSEKFKFKGYFYPFHGFF